MNKWERDVDIIIKVWDEIELTTDEQDLLNDARCYYWMYPILLRRAELKKKHRDKFMRKWKNILANN